jgi:single-strand DNA-binding protein
MSLKQPEDLGVPDETRRVAMAAFPKSCACLRIGDVWGCVFSQPACNMSSQLSQSTSCESHPGQTERRVPRRAALTSQLSNSVPREFATIVNVGSTPSGCVTKSRWAKPPQFHIINKVILIGRLGQNAEAKTAQNNKEYVVLNIATQESWKNDKGDYENRTEWHRVYAWRNLSKFAKTLQKGQLVTLEGILRYREVEDEVTYAYFVL